MFKLQDSETRIFGKNKLFKLGLEWDLIDCRAEYPTELLNF